MVAVEPLAAFSNISATPGPISTKFDKETVNDVENHLPEFIVIGQCSAVLDGLAW